MTTVAFCGRYLAADKRAICADNKSGTVTKIHRVGSKFVGFSGGLVVGLAMLEWIREGSKIEDFPKCQTADYSPVMVVSRGANGAPVLHLYEGQPFPILFEETQRAMGSGRDYALAAMHLGFNAIDAVRVASVFDSGTGNGIDVLDFRDLP